MTPRTKILSNGFKLIPYYYMGEPNLNISTEDKRVCEQAILQLQEEGAGYNYTWEGLRLNKMLLYNVVINNNEPIFVSGAQTVNENCVRIMSRYYVFKKYRTDGTYFLDKVDNFNELRYTLQFCDYPLVLWSRVKSNAIFKRIKSSGHYLFKDWEFTNNRIRLIYPNNYQYIFYKGDLNEIS
jgi:hypothetical protein